MQTVVLANHGKMCFFVTWEAFLLPAGLLGVCLFLPVDEFSQVWCQEVVVQCTAAVCQAVQQCRWVHQGLSGVCAALSASLLRLRCWDGGHNTLTSQCWPGGWCGVVFCFVSQERCRAANGASREENAYLVRKLLPYCNKVILILFWSTACCFLSPWWLAALVPEHLHGSWWDLWRVRRE